MTTTDLSTRDRRLIIRMLWALYLGALAAALACFAGLVVTGRLTFLVAGIAACLAAWFVTDPLDELRFEARIRAGAAS